MRLLLSYDIACQRRRSRVVKVLEGYGSRAQESVFQLELREAQWQRLRLQLDAIVDRRQDHWRAWPQCRSDLDDARQLGKPPAPMHAGMVVV